LGSSNEIKLVREIDLSAYSKGIYYLRAYSGNAYKVSQIVLVD